MMSKRRIEVSRTAPTTALVVGALLIGSLGCQRSEPLGPVADANEATRIRQSLASSESAGGAETTKATGTGWATLKGKFVFEGTPVKMEPYSANKDVDVCRVGGKAPLQESLIVDDASKGIKNVAIYLRKASRVHESAEKPETDEAVFDQKNCVFLSHVFPITIGQTMVIKNSDPPPVGHNTNISGKNSNNVTVAAGSTIEYVPLKEEAVPRPVTCSMHPWMIAYMLPRKTGYYAVTEADGSFEIKNLPAGETLEMQVWHERGRGNDGVLVLETKQAKDLDWSSKGRFKVTLEADEVRELTVKVPGSALGS